MAQLVEGTWEMIVARGDEFKGRHVQLKVFDTPPRPTNGAIKKNQPQNLAEALEGKIGTIDGPPTDISERAEELWGEYVEEKYRKPNETLSEIVTRIGAVDGMPSDLGARAEEHFAEIMDEKYREDLETRKVP